jgi:hypothetical protein
VSAVPPVALVLAFDLLMREVRWALERRTAAPRDLVLTRTSDAAAPPRTAQPRRAVSAAPSASGRRVQELVAAREAAGGRVSGSWLARELRVSDSYARRLLRQLGAEGEAVS